MSVEREKRTLVVLADGAQTAFAAGAVAALAATGCRWEDGFGAGLGAQVASLALLGEADEGARRWSRQAEVGCPLLRPRLAVLREGMDDGFLLLPDPWRTCGWLDPGALEEHLAPERGGLADALADAGRSLAVGVVDLGAGSIDWVRLPGASEESTALLLSASARFAGGWGPVHGEDGRSWWGGGATLAPHLPELPEREPWDLVCGFPVPPVARPGVSALTAAVQFRDEIGAASAVACWVERHSRAGVCRLIAPTQESYRRWTARDGADLAVEWPLASEHNPELVAGALAYGRFVVEELSAEV